eukprot:scaffold661629_cov41-Prasinocladus_malaysianus.AAC.1
MSINLPLGGSPVRPGAERPSGSVKGGWAHVLDEELESAVCQPLKSAQPAGKGHRGRLEPRQNSSYSYTPGWRCSADFAGGPRAAARACETLQERH